MNQSPNAAASDNPWKRPADLPRPGLPPLAVACVLYGLGALALPLCFLRPWVALVFWAVLTAGGLWLTRRMPSGLWMTLAAAAVACLAGLFIPAFGALITALAVGLAAGAFYVSCTRQWWVPVLIAAVAAGGVFALTRDWLFALLALSLLPAVLLLWLATRAGLGRTAAVGLALGGLLGWLLILFLCWVVRSTGALTIGEVRGVLGGWQDMLIAEQMKMRDEYIAMFREMIADNPTWSAAQVANVENLINLVLEGMSDAVITDTVARIFGLFPGMVFAVCSVPAFLGQKMLTAAYASNGMRRVITPESEFFTMSVPAAVLYTVSLAVMLIFPSSLSTPVIVAGNLCIMLMPGFVVLGVRFLFTRFFSTGGNVRWVIVLAAVLLCCCLTVNAVLLAGLLGAYVRVWTAVRRRMISKSGPGPGDNGGGNSDRDPF